MGKMMGAWIDMCLLLIWGVRGNGYGVYEIDEGCEGYYDGLKGPISVV
jgi:hypothetical protein